MRLPAMLALLPALIPSPGFAQQAGFDVVYAEAQDRACAATRGYEIKDAWVEELTAALPGFRALWSAKGAAMFDAAAALTHRPAEPAVMPVRLTLCDTPSQSFSGPSVNMRFALRSFSASPVPLRYKVDTAFHESLHPFVGRYVPQDSPLLAAHRSEPACVLNHLHLLALQKAVLLTVGDADALQQVIAIDAQLPSGCYRRAWSLVNESEGTFRLYVAELALRP